MRYYIILIIVFGLGLVSIVGMLTDGTRHEIGIVGEWEEVKWIYDGKEDLDALQARAKTLNNLNNIIGHEFFVHENETWHFMPDGRLATSTDEHDHDMNLKWVIKGRGNILVLKDGDQPIESYNITKLTEDTMVLYFNVDLQAKGVAELTFKRKKE